MNKLSVGQILYTKDEKEVTILSIGRKYFVTDHYRHDKYYIEDLTKVTEYSSCRERLYETIQEITDERERINIRSALESLFSWRYNKTLTLDELRSVKKIISHHLKLDK